MVSIRGGLGRIAAMAIALVLLMALLLVEQAWAGTYRVAQCGWNAGSAASWTDVTWGVKFRPEADCAAGAAEPQVKTFAREGAGTVSGTRFAGWRWSAPPGTGITAMTATWWYSLHDGFQDRIGSDPGSGAFGQFLGAAATDATPQEFSANFPWPQAGVEERLLCAKAESDFCSLEPASWSGLRALTFTLEDDTPPQVGIGGGLAGAGWERGAQGDDFWASDWGAGVHVGELQVDGTTAVRTEFPCSQGTIDGALEATAMAPCAPETTTGMPVWTTVWSDGPHQVRNCAYDFAGNETCTAAHQVLIDNNAPAAPRGVTIAGGEGWHRVDKFDLGWTDPEQGAASPIVGVSWRLTGAGGYDSGTQFAAGAGIAALAGVKVPGDGSWSLHLWLRDEAGNESPVDGIYVPLRFDDGPPSVAFADGDPSGGKVEAAAADPLAGPAAGTISYRRADLAEWIDLATKFHGEEGGKATLTAPLPVLGAGTWIFRAEAADAAGNVATTSLHADGTQMSIKVTPAEAAASGAGGKDGGRGSDGKSGARGDAGPARRRTKTRLFARLRGGGSSLTVPFGATALLSGRLTDAAGAGLSGRAIKVVARPSRGALAKLAVEHLRSGKRGRFAFHLPPGTSRRVSVSFPGSRGLAPSRHRSLDLRVRTGVSLAAAPAALVTGAAVHLSGLVSSRGAPIPRRGKLVAIQYLESDTDRWRPVLVIRTDHDGHFHARYRFRYVSDTARIRLRATALAEERWPYATGSSQPVTVTVQGR